MPTPAGNAIPLTGDGRIDGLTQGSVWDFGGGAHVLTYSLDINPSLGSGSWTAPLTFALEQALATWSAVADIQFVRVGGTTGEPENSTADLSISLTGDFLQLFFGAVGVGIFPDPSEGDEFLNEIFYDRSEYPNPEGDIFFDDAYAGFSHLQPGGYGFEIILHEIGHALGLKHPHDDGGNGRPLLTSFGLQDMPSTTVMTYFESSTTFSFSRGHVATPMLYDIVAIQHLYGANTTYASGDNVYRFTNDGAIRTIWDTGGIDTIDVSGSNKDTFLNIRDGNNSLLGGGSFTDDGTLIVIAAGVLIENAVGSRYTDWINGNDMPNTLWGGAGNDVLIGFAGADTLYGGTGDDVYDVDDAGDIVSEAGGGGHDRVAADVSYALPEGIEDLHIRVSGTGTGNALDNEITGSNLDDILIGHAGHDRLRGQPGVDLMIGGVGNDIYEVDATADTLVEFADEGIDWVYSNKTFALPDHVEHLTLTDGQNTNATGNALDNKITGNSTNNVLDGRAGFDTLVGGAGNDTYFLEDNDVVLEAANAGFDTVFFSGGGTYLLPVNVEASGFAEHPGNLAAVGAGENNTLNGNNADNLLDGGAGNDILNGLGGDDSLIGGLGNDILDGGRGSDIMQGGAGDDRYYINNANDQALELPGGGNDTVLSSLRQSFLGNELENLVLEGNAREGTGNALANRLTGNALANTLTGGAGSDVFVFNTALSAGNVDRITDFTAGDAIGLSLSIFAGIGSVGAAMSPFAFIAGTAALDASDRIVYDQSTGSLYYDADGFGAGAKMLLAQLTPGTALAATAIQVVA